MRRKHDPKLNGFTIDNKGNRIRAVVDSDHVDRWLPRTTGRFKDCWQRVYSYNVKDHQFQDVQNDPKWRDAWHASLNLCEICKRCEFHDTCGGGYLPSRWSKQRGYDNPSVYCEDLKGIFRHIQRRVLPSLYFQPGEM